MTGRDSHEDDYLARVERIFGMRRGGPLMLSPRDWQLVEKWRAAGIPIDAVLRGINRAFDMFEAGSHGARRINSLSYCKQHVEEAWEQQREIAAADGAGSATGEDPATRHLRAAAAACGAASEGLEAAAAKMLVAAAEALSSLADEAGALSPDDLDRRASQMEEELRDNLAAAGVRARLPAFSPWAV